jgi:hypothetical protein
VALAPSLVTGATASVFAIASGGRVCCLDPRSGDIEWTFSLQHRSPHLAAAPLVMVGHTVGGERRHIYVAATLDTTPDNPANGRAVLYRLNDFMPRGDAAAQD